MTATATLSTSKPLQIGLWVAQALLAAAFSMIGFMKVGTPAEELLVSMTWADEGTVWLIRFIGAAEIAGAIGLIVPAATRIKPILTPIAAALLAVVMVLAFLLHLVRGEFSALPVNVVLGGLAAFIAWGRFTKARIAPRA